MSDRQGLDQADSVHTAPQPTSEEHDERRQLEDYATQFNLSVADVEVFRRKGYDWDQIPPANTPNRRALLAYLKRSEIAPAKWVMISGLLPEIYFSEPDRRKRLRALYKAVVLLIKRALAREAADPLHEERSIYWDPTAEVCRDLEIAPSKLSSLLKEFSGHSLTQVVDCVRAEQIQKLMKRKIRSFVQEFRTQCATLATENSPSPRERYGCSSALSLEGEGEVTSWVVWKALKASRKWPEFCSNTWALEFGFSSYRRMYRACLAVWKKTPHQLEMALITECLTLDEATELVTTITDEVNVTAIEEQVRAIRCYSDDS